MKGGLSEVKCGVNQPKKAPSRSFVAADVSLCLSVHVLLFSLCVRSVLVCGRLLCAVKLSFEALFDIWGKETRGWERSNVQRWFRNRFAESLRMRSRFD